MNKINKIISFFLFNKKLTALDVSNIYHKNQDDTISKSEILKNKSHDQDCYEDNKSEQSILEQKRLIAGSIIDHIPSPLFVVNAGTGKYEFINKAAEKIMGFNKNEVLGKTYEDFYPPHLVEKMRKFDIAALETGQAVSFEEEQAPCFDGTIRSFRGRCVSIPDEEDKTNYLVSVVEDVTEVRKAEARVVKMAHFDSLTDLPNRVLFRQDLHKAFETACRGKNRAALHWIDLDYFKEVNDTLGHLVGDELLKKVAERLKNTVRSKDTVARLGGDEFAIVQCSITQNKDAEDLAARIVDVLKQPFMIGGRVVTIGASVGVAFAPEDADSLEELMMHADLALYRCKEAGRGGYILFERGMTEQRKARRFLEQGLQTAFAEKAFDIVYQPQVHVKTGHIVGCEALARLKLNGIDIPASEFIPVSEEIALIDKIGEMILRRACLEAARWPDPMKIAVNISPVQLKNKNFIQTVVSALTHAKLRPERLELEVTESTLLKDDKVNLTTLFRLRELGVSIALDDFGTGFSSLNYLRLFPFTKIKIDKSFIAELNTSLESVAIVKAITVLATSLGMQTTAEGVETQSQFDMAKDYGCSEIQGFFIARPCNVKDLFTVFQRFGAIKQQEADRQSGEAEIWLQVV